MHSDKIMYNKTRSASCTRPTPNNSVSWQSLAKTSALIDHNSLKLPTWDVVRMVFANMYHCTMVQLVLTQRSQGTYQHLHTHKTCHYTLHINYGVTFLPTHTHTHTSTMLGHCSSHASAWATHSSEDKLPWVGWVRMTYSLTSSALNWTWSTCCSCGLW